MSLNLFFIVNSDQQKWLKYRVSMSYRIRRELLQINKNSFMSCILFIKTNLFISPKLCTKNFHLSFSENFWSIREMKQILLEISSQTLLQFKHHTMLILNKNCFKCREICFMSKCRSKAVWPSLEKRSWKKPANEIHLGILPSFLCGRLSMGLVVRIANRVACSLPVFSLQSSSR